MDAILDPRTIPSATPGGYTSRMGGLPWGCGRPHKPDDFRGSSGEKIISNLAAVVEREGFTQVMAPTHLIKSIADEWLDIDLRTTNALRNRLDALGRSATPVIYPLALSYSLFRDQDQRRKLVSLLSTLPISSIWFQIENQGRTSTPAATRRYIEAARDFHSLGVPIVADFSGGVVGLSFLAFGAVGGISHGIMEREVFNTRNWKKASNRDGYGRESRVYVPAIDEMLTKKDAEHLFASARRAKSQFGCTDNSCCPRGIKDMIGNHREHFINQRMKEVGYLSGIPETIRPQEFLDRHLRATSDKAVAATQVDWNDPKIEKKMLKKRKALDSLRVVLGDCAEKNPPRSFAKHPQLRIAR